jgi:hypothetical protein
MGVPVPTKSMLMTFPDPPPLVVLVAEKFAAVATPATVAATV